MQAPHSSPEFTAAVHAALRLWAADSTAGSPLADLSLVRREAAGDGNLRRATNQVLLRGLSALARERQPDADLLRTRFLEGQSVAVAAKARHVAEATLYKMQHQAIERLAAILRAQELQAAAASSAALASRLPPPTYDRLFGVEAQLAALRTVLLAADGPGLVAIEGIGGIGKTALAHQLVRDLAQQAAPFADFGWVSAQQHFLQPAEGLRPADAPALTVQALVEALVTQLLAGGGGVAPVAPARALPALEARLRAIPHLIVVDNLETVADVASLLPTLLRLAGPSKFLLTSREAFHGQAGLYHFAAPELDVAAALGLVRHEAQLNNLPHVAGAPDRDLWPIYETVGGNPLALRLVTGQLQVLSLAQVLENLREARGKRIEELYNFIYWTAWHKLPAAAQEVLTLMPLFAQDGADLAAIRRVSDLPDDELVEALTHLARLSLVNISGGLQGRRYSIHRLTESFLLKEVIQWGGAPELAA